jgi:hypothetical protein
MDKVLSELQSFESCLMQVEKASAFLELVDLDTDRDPDFVKRCWEGSLQTLSGIKRDLRVVIKTMHHDLKQLDAKNRGRDE